MDINRKQKYIESMVNDYTKEELVELLIKRDRLLNELKENLSEIYTNNSIEALNKTIDKLSASNNELIKQLKDIQKYLLHGNEIIKKWCEIY